MTMMTGKTLSEWRKIIENDSEVILSLLKKHIDSLSEDDNAWIVLADEEQLRVQLDALFPLYHANPQALPLFGIPFAVKDNVDVAGWPTSAACPAFTYTAEHDATAVARLKAAGAVLIGKTNLDQFATGLVGTRSPSAQCRTRSTAIM